MRRRSDGWSGAKVRTRRPRGLFRAARRGAMTDRRPSGGTDLRPSALAAAVEAVASLVASRGLRSTTLVNRIARMRWFAAFAQAMGVLDLDSVTPAHVVAFIDSRRASGQHVRLSERHSRRAAVNLLYKEGRALGLASTDPGRDVRLPPRSPTHARPLTDDEVDLARSYATRRHDMRPSVCWALAEATARTSEIPHLRVSDIDLEAGTVSIHGGATTDSRVGRLTDWGTTQIRRRLAAIRPEEGPDPILIGEGRWDDPDEGRAAATMVLTGILRAARLSAPGVNPRSIPAWAGRQGLAQGATIDAVARMLGIRSLDQAVAMVRFAWLEASP